MIAWVLGGMLACLFVELALLRFAPLKSDVYDTQEESSGHEAAPKAGNDGKVAGHDARFFNSEVRR